MKSAGCYGDKVIKTPGLDELAKNGVRFTKAFCTTASCSASRSVILSGKHNHATGQYGHAHGFHHFSTFANIKTLPNILGKAGYRTATVGKFHVAPEKVYHFKKRFKGHSPKAMAQACEELIAEKNKDPFFLYFCTHEPHRPFIRGGSDIITPEEVIVPSYLPDTPTCRKELAHYYMSVQRADTGIVELIKLLKKHGHWEDTVILYCSDNGIAFPGAKTNLYEPAINLPFVFRDPSQKKQGIVNNSMVSYTSITPTLLDFAGIARKKYKFHGKSFRSIIAKNKAKGWDTIYASHTFHEITMYYPMRVVREERYKLIMNIAHGLEYPHASDLYYSPTWQSTISNDTTSDPKYAKRSVKSYCNRPKFELYDLKNDPDEIVNLANDMQHKLILKRLIRKLQAFQRQTKDPWRSKWIYE